MGTTEPHIQVSQEKNPFAIDPSKSVDLFDSCSNEKIKPTSEHRVSWWEVDAYVCTGA
jgi:hypothetical protein